MNAYLRRAIAAAVLSLLTSCLPGQADAISDNFESYTAGTFPSSLWSDVGAVFPVGFVPPLPSATVISTTDAFGNPTQALATVGDLGDSKGIYASVPVNPIYALFADVRVDRYSDQPSSPAADWGMQLSFAQFGVDNFAFTPQAGIYASSLTQDWRLILISHGNGGPDTDIDLGVPATVGRWYRVEQTFDTTVGVFHSRILDIALGTVLTDRTDTIPGWQPQFGQFDTFAFFSGETSSTDTRGNIGVIDNINVTSAPVPEPATGLLVVTAGLAFLVSRRRRAPIV